MIVYAPFRDLSLKLLALGIAVLLWVTVAGDRVIERGLVVPLELENIPGDLEVGGDLPDTVRVRVRGPAGVVGGLQPSDVVALLDLGEEEPGQHLFDLFDGRVRAPAGVELTRVAPATLTVTLERAGFRRSIGVVPDIVGAPADGFVVGRIQVDPATVEVVGPETTLQKLDQAFTEPVSVAGARGPVEATVTVGVADPALRLATPVAARVTVDIIPAPLEQTVHDVPVTAREAGRRATIAPDRVTVGVRGPRAAVQALDEHALHGYVDLAGLQPGRYNLPVTIESPDEIRVMHIDPPSVRVTLR